MKSIVWLLVASLIIFHQDFWNWNKSDLFFGFMPIGLWYHVCISLAAAMVWLFACTFAWPAGIDEFEDESVENGGKV